MPADEGTPALDALELLCRLAHDDDCALMAEGSHPTARCDCCLSYALSDVRRALAPAPGVPVATAPVAWQNKVAVLAELELMTPDDDTEEAAQCDKRWHSWAMRQASIIHGGNASQTVASAIAWARIIVGHAPPAGEPTPALSREAVEAAIEKYGDARGAEGFCHLKANSSSEAEDARSALLALITPVPVAQEKNDAKP